VESVPDHDPSRELAVAEEQHRELAATARARTKELTRTEERVRVVAAELERYRERLELLDLQRSTLPDVLAPADPDPDSEPSSGSEATTERGAGAEPGDDLDHWVRLAEARMGEVDGAAELYRVANDTATALEDERDAAARREQGVRDAAQQIERDLAEVRQSVADLDPPAPAHRSLLADYQTLADWAAEQVATLADERTEVAAEGKRLSQKKSDLLASLAEAAAAVGVAGDLDDLPATAARAEAEAEADVADARRRRAEADELAARIAELDAERVVDEALGRHLRAGGFARWLLAEALDNIVAKASAWLLELSNRQYSLVAGDGTFAIIDHNNADEIRNVRTLSGGETFLASLSLALALADSVGELAPVDSPGLDSMFLDEGFGTLDPATLDVVAGAIEELASSGRMIGIVTHVGDLAERLPARFQVTKGPTTSTVELVSQ
jgi:exonuclease SbcC